MQLPVHLLEDETICYPADVRLGKNESINSRLKLKPHTDLKAWNARREMLKEQILVSAGLVPMPARGAVNAVITGETVQDDLVIKNIRIETLPGFFLAANLYLPRRISGKIPAVLNPHGHWENHRFERTELCDVPARCASLARAGFAALTYDMTGRGDTRQIPHGFRSTELESWGISLLGIQLFNSIRCVDYLCSLDFVDAARIACTGASGGGTQTILLSAVDERIAAAAPVNMVSASMQGGCECEHVPGLRFDTDNTEIAALMAPRPMMLTGCTGDWTSEMPSVEYPAIHEIYSLYGAGERFQYFYCDSLHNYRKDVREAVVSWLIRTFMPEAYEGPISEEAFAVDEAALHVTYPADAKNFAQIMDAYVADRRRDAARLMDEQGGIERIRRALSLSFGTGKIGAAFVRGEETTREEGGYTLHSFMLGTEAGERVPARLVTRAGQTLDGARIALVVKDRTDSEFAALNAAGLLSEADAVLFVDPFLTGAYLNPYFAVGRNIEDGRDWKQGELDTDKHQQNSEGLMQFHRTDTALRVCDILMAASFCRSLGAKEVLLIGLGRRAAEAAVALALTEDVSRAWLEGAFVPQSGVPALSTGFYQPGLLGLGGFEAVRRAWRAQVQTI